MADVKMTQLRKARVRALRVVAAYASMRELSETEFRRLERFPERLNRGFPWPHESDSRFLLERGPVMDGKTVLERSSRTRRCGN